MNDHDDQKVSGVPYKKTSTVELDLDKNHVTIVCGDFDEPQSVTVKGPDFEFKSPTIVVEQLAIILKDLQEDSDRKRSYAGLKESTTLCVIHGRRPYHEVVKYTCKRCVEESPDKYAAEIVTKS